MKMIKWAANIIEGNIHEARNYVDQYFKVKDTNADAAAWCLQMARSHLSFNDSGHDIVKRMIADAQKSSTKSELIEGMMAIWNDKHADMIRETAEIKAMIDMAK